MKAAVPVRLLCVIAACIGIALAAPAGAQAPPSENSLKLAKEFVEIVGATRNFESVPTAVIVQTATIYVQANPSLSKDVNEIVDNLIKEYFARRDEIPNEIIRLYATKFSEKELTDLLGFYKSPLGKKLQAESRTIMGDTVQRADALAA